MLTVNALTAADNVIVPMTPEYLALIGFALINETISKVQKINPNLKLMGILITMYDSRATHYKEIVQEMRNKYPVFKTIKRSVKFADSVLAGQSILDFDKTFEGSKEYQRLAEEVTKWEPTKELA
jgi:chromosome partitioning protein